MKLMYVAAIAAILAFTSCASEPQLVGTWKIVKIYSNPEPANVPNYYLEIAENNTFVYKVDYGSGQYPYTSGDWQMLGSDVLEIHYFGTKCGRFTIADLTDTQLHLTPSAATDDCDDGLTGYGDIKFERN
jgi:hypothetical protein